MARNWRAVLQPADGQWWVTAGHTAHHSGSRPLRLAAGWKREPLYHWRNYPPTHTTGQPLYFQEIKMEK